jgi:phage terminase large subunit-like protein
VIVTVGPTGLQKPDKQKSREKIDGIVAAIMALAGGMAANDSYQDFTPTEIAFL